MLDALTPAVKHYVWAQQLHGTVLLVLGFVVVALSAWTLHRKRGALVYCLPFLVVGVLQGGLGTNYRVSTRGEPATTLRRLTANSEAASLAQLQGLEQLQQRHSTRRRVELVLLLVSALLAAWGARRERRLLLGLGLGSVAACLLMMASDAVASERALAYARELAIFRFSLLP